MEWTKGPLGLSSSDGVWRIRPITFGLGHSGGKKMFWIYRDGHRYTPTGRYDDAVSAPTVAAAKKIVAAALSN